MMSYGIVEFGQNGSGNGVVLDSTKPLPETMMTSSNGNIFRVTGPLCGEFTGYPVTGYPHKGQWHGALMFPLICAWMSKQSWGWWFEMPSRSLWRQCNAMSTYCVRMCVCASLFLLVPLVNLVVSEPDRGHPIDCLSTLRWWKLHLYCLQHFSSSPVLQYFSLQEFNILRAPHTVSFFTCLSYKIWHFPKQII